MLLADDRGTPGRPAAEAVTASPRLVTASPRLVTASPRLVTASPRIGPALRLGRAGGAAGKRRGLETRALSCLYGLRLSQTVLHTSALLARQHCLNSLRLKQTVQTELHTLLSCLSIGKAVSCFGCLGKTAASP